MITITAMTAEGQALSSDLEKTGERQYILLETHAVHWMRLERMQKSNAPSTFPAQNEWKVFDQG